MQYVRSFSGSVSKTWNSINPATLSGAIDVIVVEQEDGTLACSPFHVRFGKISLLRPYDKKVEFKVNNVKQDYSMKLGEGGEAFFVFETSAEIPESLQTSPLVSPAGSPSSLSMQSKEENQQLQEPEFLDLSATTQPAGPRQRPLSTVLPSRGLFLSEHNRAQSDLGNFTPLSSSPKDSNRPVSQGTMHLAPSPMLVRSASVRLGDKSTDAGSDDEHERPKPIERISEPLGVPSINASPDRRSISPPPLTTHEALNRAMALSKKLSATNIPTHVTETGDLMLDMQGYKSNEEDALRAEVIARQVLAEELDGNYDIGALIGADEQGNLWIFSSEEAKEAALRKIQPSLMPQRKSLDDAASDPGYHSDDDRLLRDAADEKQMEQPAIGLQTPPQTPPEISAGDPNRNYAKTLRLTSDQLKALNLKPGENSMSFTVNKATCQASMFYWKYNVPVVISDIDGTITKSDALGHVLNMIGRDWTHLGVAKLYRDIVANGYNLFYLTSRSVGQADTTRNYLNSIVQEGYKLPRGPVILSPDRTVAALRREVYLRKPEVFKMACLRDIMTLFGNQRNPFYAGFGNRFTDALSYRSVNIPSNRIFTINSNAEVSLDLLTLSKYKSSYVSMQEILDHFFPPVGLLVASGGENYTDFNYWRDTPLEVDDFSASDSDEASEHGSVHRSEEEGSELEDEEYDEDEEEPDEAMRDSFVSQDSLDEGADLIDSVNRHMTRSERSSRETVRSDSSSRAKPTKPARRGRSPQRPTSR